MLNVILLAAEVMFLAGVAFGLHRLSARFGLAPLLFYLGALAATLQFVSPLAVDVALLPGLVIRVASTLLVPVILSIVLLIYAIDGTAPARIAIVGVLAATLLGRLVLQMLRAHLALPGGFSLAGLTPGDQALALSPHVVFASMTAYLLALSGAAIVFQGCRNLMKPRHIWGATLVAMISGLLVDTLVFQVLVRLGSSQTFSNLGGDLASKLGVALLLWPLVALYLSRAAPRWTSSSGPQSRPAFDVLFGSYGRLAMSLRATEQALRQQAEFLEQIQQHISGALWLADVSHMQAVYMSPAYDQIMGRPREQLSNLDAFVQVVHPEDRERVRAQMLAPPTEPFEIVYRIARPDGEVRWIHDRGFPVLDEDGKVYRMAGIAEDITALKEAEQARFELEMEREQVRLLRELIGDVSHDLRSPLTALKIKNYLAATTSDPVQREAHIDAARQQILRLERLVENLLTIARLDSITQLDAEPVNINDIVREVSYGVEPLAESRGHTLSLELAPDLPLIPAERLNLARTLTNLVENACHYTPPGGQIVLRTLNGSEPRVVVQDNGYGMRPEELKHLYERFFRGRSAAQAGQRGSGLGLSIVKQIVDRHGWRIDVESAIDQGTTFTIYFKVDSRRA